MIGKYFLGFWGFILLFYLEVFPWFLIFLDSLCQCLHIRQNTHLSQFSQTGFSLTYLFPLPHPDFTDFSLVYKNSLRKNLLHTLNQYNLNLFEEIVPEPVSEICSDSGQLPPGVSFPSDVRQTSWHIVNLYMSNKYTNFLLIPFHHNLHCF